MIRQLGASLSVSVLVAGFGCLAAACCVHATLLDYL
jgi:hypothetical protein